MTASLDDNTPPNPVDPDRIRVLWRDYRFADVAKTLAGWLELQLTPKQVKRVQFLQAQNLFKQNRIDEFDRLCRAGVVADRPDHLLARLQYAMVAGDLAGAGTLMTALERDGTPTSILATARRAWSKVVTEARHGPHPLQDRVLCILGTSYCGSTFLASVLGSLPECENVGESYRLVRSSRTNTAGYHDQNFRFGSDAPALIEPCLACGPECRLYDFDFRAQLAKQPAYWYETILEKSGAQRLVATDKTQTSNLAPSLQHRYIVLFKSPQNAYMSAYKRAIHIPDAAGKAAHAAGYLRNYARAYGGHLHSKNIRDRALFMSWEHFTKAPQQHLAKIASHFNLEYKPATLTERQATQHCFGGNADLNRHLAAHPERSTLRALARPQRTVLQQSGYQTASPADWAEQVHAGLMRRYRTQLNAAPID